MKKKKILGFIQVLLIAWMIFFIVPETNISAANVAGMGNVSYEESRTISENVVLDKIMSTNVHGVQKAHLISVGKNALTPLVTFGERIYDDKNNPELLTKMIKVAEAQQGKKVVAAINGDFYDTNNKVPTGMMIINGRLVTTGTSGNSHNLLGIKADGTAIYGRPSVSIKVNDGVSDLSMAALNNDRKDNTSAIFMYTSEYGTRTRNIKASTPR